MRSGTVLAAVFVLAQLCGCVVVSHRGPRPDRPVRTTTGTAIVSGMLVRVSSNQYVMADLSKARVNADRLDETLIKDDYLHTSVPVKIDFMTASGDQYYAVVGPDPNAAPGTEAKCHIGSMVVDSGFAWLWGSMPVVTTEWVSAAAEGTTIAVEMKNGSERVYFLRENSSAGFADVCCLSNEDIHITMQEPCYFVEFTNSACANGGQAPTTGDQDAKAFINRVKPIARAAGWNEEPNSTACTQ